MARILAPRLVLSGLALIVVAATVVWALRLRGVTVDTVPVATRALQQTVVVSGRVLAPAKIDIGATVTARVARVAVQEGDRVAAGQALVELERSELAAALAQAEAVEAAARTRIAQWREVGAPGAQQQLAQAEANLAIAEKDARRQEDLFRQGFIGAARLDEVRRTLAVAQAQATTARANAAANRDDGSERRLLDDQLAQARAAREAAAARLTQTRIVAPAAGVVLDRAVEPGDVVQPGKRLLGLLQDGEFKLTALIDEKNLALLKPGQPAIAAADAYPAQRFRATLDYLAPGVDLQRGTVEAKFRVPEPPALLRADMTVSIDIEVAARPNARVVPAAALRGPVGEAPWVLALRDGRAERVAVRAGARSAAEVEIEDGLAAGDVVILSPGIAPGDRVRPR
ncbi:MAG: efflux RND transporter periplasmic adaptor subunit [Betaproteobacteria bacterium]|jgi:HlyD family secretion protein|nr:efflux RND transporter periplasmic adaptor subunit [Betaproteobacteria bacterium]MBK7081294.1 efflux RND transporter periplasmic adaptor subunit [Betaproteobacteria bacterium]MBK7589838.1 efflux RND transporter periplasmic adaptor subunit [Betaproteobacteria bacterium]MBK7744683.1 efflux RND transporter periplasmic adaptor subunit [Betaproteobacteria bacterium]